MRTAACYLSLLVLASAAALPAQHPPAFTLQQALSAPYATQLTAAPTGGLFAWVENSEGRINLFVGGRGADGKTLPARQLTHNTEDDAQDIAQLAWSPDASALAYTFGAESGADGKPANPAHLQRPTPVTVEVQPIGPDAAAHTVGEGHSPLFLRDGRSLLFVRGGQIWIAELTSSAPAHQLVFDRGAASSLTLSPDGNTLAFISRRSEANQPAHSFLALYDLRTHTLTFPAPSTGDDLAPAWSPDGEQLAWLRAPFTQGNQFQLNRSSPNPWSIVVLERASGRAHPAFTAQPNAPGSVLPHLANSDPRLFFAASNRLLFYSEADGWVHLYALDPQSTAPPQRLTPGPYEVEEAALTADHRTLVFSANNPAADPLDADRRHLYTLDLTQPAARPVALTRGPGIEARPAVAGSQVAALVSDARTPMQPALLQPDGARLPLHPDANPATYPAAAFVVPQSILFRAPPQLPARPGAAIGPPLTIHAQLFVPRALAPGRHPAIIFFHGGARRQMLLGYPGMDYYSNAYAMNQYLASRGFLVLSVNYRCGIGYGLDFRQCVGYGAAGAGEYADVVAAARYLRSRPDVDPRRIALWGGSYGGYLTALGLARDPELFAAGVDFHGVHDWNLEDNAGGWLTGSYAQRDAIAARALASSPLADVSRWRAPVLFIHGDNDPEVAYAQTPLLADKLRARGVPVEELIFPDEVHGFLLHRDWLTAYEAEAAFFARVLQRDAP